jgi:hypothetical protein
MRSRSLYGVWVVVAFCMLTAVEADAASRRRAAGYGRSYSKSYSRRYSVSYAGGARSRPRQETESSSYVLPPGGYLLVYNRRHQNEARLRSSDLYLRTPTDGERRGYSRGYGGRNYIGYVRGAYRSVEIGDRQGAVDSYGNFDSGYRGYRGY